MTALSYIRADILLYRGSDQQPQAVLLEDGLAVEWLPSQSVAAAAVKDIVLGQIATVDKGLQRVFVDIGEAENGMLPLKEAPLGCKEGQSLIVQIRRLPKIADDHAAYDTDKGPLLTTKIQFAGPFAVYEPAAGVTFLRTKSKTLSLEDRDLAVARDLKALQKQAEQVKAAADAAGPIPRRLLRLHEPLTRALTDWTRPDLASIQAADLELFNEADQWLNTYWPALKPVLKLSAGPFALAEIHRITDLARESKRRKIHLKNGGSIVLDQAEALLAIDVNTGKAQGSDNSKLRLQTNLQAASEIARQLRLRNISGLIVVDFIRLSTPEDHETLTAAFKTALDRDPAKMKLGGWTSLGLYELIRQTR